MINNISFIQRLTRGIRAHMSMRHQCHITKIQSYLGTYNELPRRPDIPVASTKFHHKCNCRARIWPTLTSVGNLLGGPSL